MQKLMETLAQINEDKMPSKAHIMKMCKDGKSKKEICDMHPDCDQGKLKDMIDDCMKELKESIEEGGDYDDLGLSGLGSELDKDDDGDGAGYKQAPMYDQLGKVLDSRGNPNPVSTVTTDDGKEFKVTVDQARTIRMLMTTEKVKPMVRKKFQDDMQKSTGIADFLDIKDYHEIPQLFVKRYLG